MTRWSFALLALARCTPTPSPSVVTPSPDGNLSLPPCAAINEIDNGRLIRTADGSALYKPCDAGTLSQ